MTNAGAGLDGAPTMTSVPTRASKPVTIPDLVGREHEIATLTQLVASTVSGEAATVTFGGEAGMGKSALVRRTMEIARHQGLRVLGTQCVRLEMGRAFGPFIDALGVVRERGQRLREALSATAPVEAGPLSQFDRYRRHAAFGRAITELTEERPLLLAIDDLQWADDSSLELFAYLSRRIPRSLLLLSAYRVEDLETRVALRRALRDVARERTTELTLNPLTAAEVGCALSLILGRSRTMVSSSARELLRARSGGNPLFLEEIVRALFEHGQLTRAEQGWRLRELRSIPLPRTVQESMREHYRALDETTQRVLAMAAIIGERFRYDVLRESSQLDEPALIAALRAAKDAQLIIEIAEESDVFAFHHALTRDAIREQLLRRERRALHGQVAAAMDRLGLGARHLAEFAYHHEESGDSGRAHALHLACARLDLKHSAFGGALRHFQRALELAPNDEGLVAELQLEVSRLALLQRFGQRALAAAEDARSRFERLGDRRGVARALHLLIRTAALLGAPRTERERLRSQFSAVAEELGQAHELSLAYSELALEQLDDFEIGAAVITAERALRIAELTDDTYARALALDRLGCALMDTDAQRSIATLREELKLAESLDVTDRLWSSVSHLADAILRQFGETEEYRALIARRTVLEERFGIGKPEITRLYRMLRSADWDDFLRAYEDEEGDTLDWAQIGIGRALIEVARHGEQHLERLVVPRDRLLAADTTGTLWARTGEVAEVLLVAGRPADALEALEPAGALMTERLPYAPLIRLAAVYGLVAASASDDAEASDRWLRRVREDQSNEDSDRAAQVDDQIRRYAAAERSLQDGDPNEAIRVLRTVLDDCMGLVRSDIVSPLTTHFIRIRYVELLARRAKSGDVEAAARELAIDVAFWTKASAKWYLQRLERRLNAWGLRMPTEFEPPRVTPLGALTPREREVALLVREGLTNREIAARLALSIRTAESHVEQIRTKLSLRTRAQIAAWVTERSGARPN